ncbi:addiction module toxin, HicA family [Xylophilus rhododendri]|uniref:Addiction module toxin, HicA family n=1 Tax=Xylophilus rhododendri TaxID=2697032 RepID=A0A857J481_9BURK|nr:type II toxin-antitoxin system HicA family toxin [Xylophilus rhododendri]QHI97678.1 addiction module toxin, HicA family [Xylophilus rhododendri]
MDSKQIVRRLLAEGWVKVAVVGSHTKFKLPGRMNHVVVPHPKKDLPIGTVRSIYRQAGWQWKE